MISSFGFQPLLRSNLNSRIFPTEDSLTKIIHWQIKIFHTVASQSCLSKLREESCIAS
jgi:hypothetical protein